MYFFRRGSFALDAIRFALDADRLTLDAICFALDADRLTLDAIRFALDADFTHFAWRTSFDTLDADDSLWAREASLWARNALLWARDSFLLLIKIKKRLMQKYCKASITYLFK